MVQGGVDVDKAQRGREGEEGGSIGGRDRDGIPGAGRLGLILAGSVFYGSVKFRKN